MADKYTIRKELEAYLAQCESQRGQYLESGMVRTIEDALDRAQQALGEAVTSLASVADETEKVSAASAAMLLAGVIPRLQEDAPTIVMSQDDGPPWGWTGTPT